MIYKEAKTLEPIHDILAKRWSPRAFDPDKKVSRENIISICEAGRWAPSSMGDEPWRYVVWDKFHSKEDWERAFNCLNEGNQKWAKNAPVLLASFTDHKFSKNGKHNRHAEHDTGAASENICLQATALGLKAHQMGGFDPEKLKQEFSIPEEYTALSVIAIGYQADESILDEKNYKSEIAERKRKPISLTFFDSNWENPLMKDM